MYIKVNNFVKDIAATNLPFGGTDVIWRTTPTNQFSSY